MSASPSVTACTPASPSVTDEEATEKKTTSCSCYCHIERKLASLCLKTGHVIGISQWRPSSSRCACALCLSRDELEERLARPETDRQMEGRNRQLQRHLDSTLDQLSKEQRTIAHVLAKSQRVFAARQRTKSRRQSCNDDVVTASSNFRAKSHHHHHQQQQQQQQQHSLVNSKRCLSSQTDDKLLFTAQNVSRSFDSNGLHRSGDVKNSNH